MKKRIDQLIVEKGLAPSREKAKALIMSGVVYINEQKVLKAGEEFEETSEIKITESLRYVSRGGLKLEKAINLFAVDLKGKVCADIGASTGGFTDCMLQNGAKKVYSVDVGYGQLAWTLRQDNRVVCLERTNARYLNNEIIKDKLSFYSMDVSFISVKLIIPVLAELVEPDAEAVILIKPQFEAGRNKVGKNGVVRDKDTHIAVINDILSFLIKNNYGIKGLTYSPVKGPKGNIEFLVYAKLNAESNPFDIDSVVESAHSSLTEV